MTLTSFITLAGLAAIVVVTAVVSEQVVQRPAVPGRVTILYWEKWTGSEGEEMRKSVDAFNNSQDRVFVRYLSISDVANKTLLSTAAGDPPDVAGLWAENVPQFADAHALVDLKEMAGKAGLTESYYIPGYWKEINYRGGLWALPSTPASTAMHVNAALVPPQYATPKTFPQTIEKYDDVVSKLNKMKDGRLVEAGFMPSEPGWWNFAWGYWFGGNLLDGDRLTINSPENVKGFEWVASFGKTMGVQPMQAFQSGFGNFSSPQDAFMDGKVATELHGVYKANYIHIYRPNMKWFAVAFPHPADRPDLANRTALNSDVYMIPRGAKHPEEAFEFVKYMQRQDVMESICSRHGKNSPLEKVSEGFFKTHPNPFIRLFDSLARSPGAFSSPLIGIEPEIADEMNNVFSEVNLGQKTPKEALDDAQSRLDREWITYQDQVLNVR